jgi:NADH-quinone oxidoreductase subunit M
MNLLLHPLVLVTFFPLLGVLVLALLPASRRNAIRYTAVVTTLITFGISMWVLALFDRTNPNLQMVIDQPWFQVARLPVSFLIGIDGLSLLMVLLTTFLTPIAIFSSWTAVEERVKGFMIFFLLLEVGMIGVFLALDLVLFYVFWEFALIPMYFLIGIFGGENRIYAALKFFLYTFAGSVLMLLAILYIGWQAETFALPALVAGREVFAAGQILLFLAFALAFAIKVPVWPLHSWLPDAHVEAPTAGSVILAGVLLKMGAYGFLRFNIPLFPEAAVQLAPYLAGLGVIGVLYGGAVALAQRDVKKLVAYSSVSHLGFVVLGIFALNPEGISGSILQMVNHGLSTGALFLIVGMLYERRHTRQIAAFGGLWKVMPYMGGLALVVVLSSMALPGTNGFVGEFTILLGAFGSTVLATPLFAGLATLGVILAAVYLLYMFSGVFLGPITHPENQTLTDANWREWVLLVPLLIMIFWIGLYPAPFFNLINPTVDQLVSTIQSAALALH